MNEDSNISAVIFYSQPQVEHTCSVKKELMQNNFTFHNRNVFSLNVWLSINFYNKPILEPKMKQKTATGWQKLRTTWCNGKLHGSMTLGIHVFVKLEIKTRRIKKELKFPEN